MYRPHTAPRRANRLKSSRAAEVLSPATRTTAKVWSCQLKKSSFSDGHASNNPGLTPKPFYPTNVGLRVPYSPTTAHNHLCPASPLHDVFPPPQFRRERCYLSAKLAPHLTHQHVSATQISRSNASAHTRYLLTIAFHPFLRPSHSIHTAPWGGKLHLIPPMGRTTSGSP